MSDTWQRLDPRMLLIHPIKELRRAIVPMIGVILAGPSVLEHGWWIGLAVAVVAILAGCARWVTTTFRMTPSRVELRTGLVSRKTLTVNVDRVRSVDLTSPLIHRILGLSQVRIGTGAGDAPVALDGLAIPEARALRGRLLHRMPAGQTGTLPVEPGPGAPGAAPAYDAVGEVTLLRMEPGWLRFAPLNPTGLMAAWALIGALAQPIERRFNDLAAGRRTLDWLESLGVLAGSVVVVAVVGALVVALSFVAYLLEFHGFRLTRDAAHRTIEVSRGLVTSRVTGIETRRIRGVSLREPVPLRWARGATLAVIATGLKEGDKGESSLSTVLVPPSPRAVGARIAGEVMRDPAVLQLPLGDNGPKAVRRRWTRALGGAAILVALLLVAMLWWEQWWLVGGIVVLVIAAPLLAWDRASRLGHALTDRFLVVRTGGLGAATQVIDRRGVIAVTTRATLFQRRAGVATLHVALAAGNVRVLDLPADRAARLAEVLLRSSSGTTSATASGCRE